MTAGSSILFEPLLIKKVQAEFAVNVPFGYRRPGGIDIPLDADNLRVAGRHVLDVDEIELFGDLLLQRDGGLGGIGCPDDLGIDAELGDPEEAVPRARHWVRQGLAQYR